MLTSEHNFSLFLCFSLEHMFSTQSLTQMMLGLLGLSTLHGLCIKDGGEHGFECVCIYVYVKCIIDNTLK